MKHASPTEVLIQRLQILRREYDNAHANIARHQAAMREQDVEAAAISKSMGEVEKAIVALGGQVPARGEGALTDSGILSVVGNPHTARLAVAVAPDSPYPNLRERLAYLT